MKDAVGLTETGASAYFGRSGNGSATGANVLIFDPFAGISGDMTLGALLDLGLSLEWLRGFVEGLGIGEVEVSSERVERSGIACTRLLLQVPDSAEQRRLDDLLEIVDRSHAGEWVERTAAAAFRALAAAEARVHGTTPEQVHFHEVGAIDSIVDVFASIAGCAELGFADFRTRPVTLGRGWVEMAHGRHPVPPPAVPPLLEGVAVRDPDFEGECTTPTGAAILRTLTAGRPPPSTWVPRGVGYGAGARDPHDRPNCLRVIAAEVAAEAAEMRLLQTDIDDLEPEFVPPLLDAMLAAGALDASATPLLMKKGRPGVRIEALVERSRAGAVHTALYSGSSSIGVRSWSVDREALPRSRETVRWRGHEIRVKRSLFPGGARAKPEFEDVARAAVALGMTPYQAYRAMRAEGIAAEFPARCSTAGEAPGEHFNDTEDDQ
ncbi:nickel pincer cofactor biosynthesis protein LarC [soil metagenome]